MIHIRVGDCIAPARPPPLGGASSGKHIVGLYRLLKHGDNVENYTCITIMFYEGWGFQRTGYPPPHPN
jgi:hypothetical protein